VVARHGRAPLRQQLLFRLDVGGLPELKIGTLLVASTLLDLTPSTALHAQFRASKPIELQQANSSNAQLSGRPTLTIATPFTK
jgi:hypothetical protein